MSTGFDFLSSEKNERVLIAICSQSKRALDEERETLEIPGLLLCCGSNVWMSPFAYAITSGILTSIRYLVLECRVNPSTSLTIQGRPSSFIMKKKQSSSDSDYYYYYEDDGVDDRCPIIMATPLSWVLFLSTQHNQQSYSSILSMHVLECLLHMTMQKNNVNTPFQCEFSCLSRPSTVAEQANREKKRSGTG